MNLYNTNQWKKYRDNVIECDGYKCSRCGRTDKEVVLQVHHKIYLKGKLPWEYPTHNCETVCKGCHAAEHGIIQPKVGWEFHGQEDLGDLIGTCENSGCGNMIRHVYLISHPSWGFLEVGTVCCDNLTDSNIASNNRETKFKYNNRKTRFISSPRWKMKNDLHQISQVLFNIEIKQKNNLFFINIHNIASKKEYPTLDLAKEAAFDAIESGKFQEYLDIHKIEYMKKNE